MILWLLTGRSGDFVSSRLNTGIAYTSDIASEELNEMRQLLNLHKTSTDFYVVGAMAAALYSTPPGSRISDDYLTLFQGGGLILQSPTCDVDLLPSSAKVWPNIDSAGAGLLGVTQLTVTYYDSQHVLITDDNGGSTIQSYTTFDEGAIQRLIIPYLADHGVNAHFDKAWTNPSTITITFAPQVFLYKSLAETIQKNTTAVTVMNRVGLLEGFMNARRAYDKVGFAALAIILSASKSAQDDHLVVTVNGEDATVDLAWVEDLTTTPEPNFNA